MKENRLFPQKCRRALLALAAAGLLSFSGALAADYADGVYQDLAPGYNDDVIVSVTVRDGKITEFDAKNRNGNESEYFGKALEGIRQAVLEKQGLEGVDAVSGATGSSDSMLTAMKGILEQLRAGGGEGSVSSENTPSAQPSPTVDPATAQVFSGLGSTANFRNGPGKDAEGTPVYSFNIAMANALFDREGKILNVFVDVYEVSTPNYDGETMPHFSGWPGRERYNVTDPATGKVTGVSQNTEESAAEELSQWKTKRDRGDGYGMNPSNEWYIQMNAYQQWMTGKTVAELRDWYGSSTRPSTGRPLDPASNAEEDQERLSALSQQEKDDLADLRSMATMSLSDSHGLLLEAIEKAYENRVPVGGVAVE